QHVIAHVNVQHDCPTRGCAPTALVHVRQEREETKTAHRRVAHTDNLHFIVNTASLHNYTHLKDVIPADLHAPLPAIDDVECV
ncbi:hypothetical protein BOTBODRAFT_110460, partial [Botryobasidium botryosum FD-172 SS1]